ncbi:MAG: hypothetical protein HY814_13835 [Candidatus Riflebacteria bacterium]|nr:hypothetical protein [Candidatus Riflebacteria bacterium]
MKQLQDFLKYAFWPVMILAPWLLVLSWEHPVTKGRWPLGNPLFTYFLVFVLVVTVILSLVLRHLIQRSKRQPASPGKIYTFLEELLRKDPTAERFHEAGVFCCESGEWDRAVQYLQQVRSPDERLCRSARYHLLLAFVESGRIEEASRLQSELPSDELTSDERYNLALACKKHNFLGRAKELFLKLFLMDIGFRDVGKQLEEIGNLERSSSGLEPAHEFLRGAIAERYGDLRVVAGSGPVLHCTALDRDLGRPVVLRVLSPGHASEEGIEEFLAQAKALAALDHPGILKVYDIRKDRLPYFSVETFEGQPAEHALANRPLVQRVAVLMRLVDLAEAVGGFEPSHLLVGERGEVRLTAAPVPNTQVPHTFLLGLLESASGLHPGVARALQSAKALLEAHASPAELRRAVEWLDRCLRLESEERDRAAFGVSLRWLERAHRQWIHGLKSKFAVTKRFPGEGEKAVSIFGRPANLAETDRMLAGLAEQIAGRGELVTAGCPPLTALIEELDCLDVAEIRSRLRRIQELPVPDAGALLTELADRFVGLSTGIARLLETYEVALDKLIEGIVRGSVYAPMIEFAATNQTAMAIRVTRPEEFRSNLRTALENCLHNSFEADARTVSVSLLRGLDQRYVEVRLVDDGRGVSPEMLERLARERFSSKAGGTGTGLLSSMRLVERHGGTLELSNRTDGRPGAQAVVTLTTMME